MVKGKKERIKITIGHKDCNNTSVLVNSSINSYSNLNIGFPNSDRHIVIPDDLDYMCKIMNFIIDSMSEREYKRFVGHMIADKL